MEKILNKKHIVLGIILLFFAMSIIPANAGIIQTHTNTPTSKTITSTPKNGLEYPNQLCYMEVIINRVFQKPDITIITVEDGHFNFTKENGYVVANFTLACETWARTNTWLPFYAVFGITIFDGDSAGDKVLKEFDVMVRSDTTEVQEFGISFSVEIDSQGYSSRNILCQCRANGFSILRLFFAPLPVIESFIIVVEFNKG